MWNNVAQNVQYTSSNIQNKLLELFATLIQEHIAAKVNTSPYFVILVHEITDAFQKEQLSLSIRYVDYTDNEHIIIKDLLCYVIASDLTDNTLAQLWTLLLILGCVFNKLEGRDMMAKVTWVATQRRKTQN